MWGGNVKIDLKMIKAAVAAMIEDGVNTLHVGPNIPAYGLILGFHDYLDAECHWQAQVEPTIAGAAVIATAKWLDKPCIVGYKDQKIVIKEF